jgi:hypothetical protein
MKWKSSPMKKDLLNQKIEIEMESTFDRLSDHSDLLIEVIFEKPEYANIAHRNSIRFVFISEQTGIKSNPFE